MMPNTMFLNDESTWPTQLLGYLEQYGDLFLAWELGSIGTHTTPSSSKYDRAIYGLRAVLRNYALHGYHCTRLTDFEINQIIAEGMQLPNGMMLHGRIHAIETAGLIQPRVAERLRNENQADKSSKVGMIWFCFFPPKLAGQRGSERLFRSWGGEALYSSHEDDPTTGPILRSIGVPCLIEADVPITSLEVHSFLDVKIIRQFLVNRGLETQEPIHHEDRAKHPIPAYNIRRVIRFSDRVFSMLTNCDQWTPPLT